ncbi:hypothetical protein [Polaribacter aquimarinus]|uniref:Uncharacterized protein n=1 Tax=Polaribacter aquimarinus TaxID=2100726 RepID=A0A2U2J9I7_9FLAO|nr:hypothetical protein [Polaribacter aquimarinus]PWG04984.1 hypothetical protein DIS07_11000 [Polaribacter aquimarinus]
MTPKSKSKWYLLPFVLLFINLNSLAQIYNINDFSVNANTILTDVCNFYDSVIYIKNYKNLLVSLQSTEASSFNFKSIETKKQTTCSFNKLFVSDLEILTNSNSKSNTKNVVDLNEIYITLVTEKNTNINDPTNLTDIDGDVLTIGDVDYRVTHLSGTPLIVKIIQNPISKILYYRLSKELNRIQS